MKFIIVAGLGFDAVCGVGRNMRSSPPRASAEEKPVVRNIANTTQEGKLFLPLTPQC